MFYIAFNSTNKYMRKESGEWLHAAPMSAIGLRMEDEVLWVAGGLRLVVALCRPHNVISVALKWTIWVCTP